MSPSKENGCGMLIVGGLALWLAWVIIKAIVTFITAHIGAIIIIALAIAGLYAFGKWLQSSSGLGGSPAYSAHSPSSSYSLSSYSLSLSYGISSSYGTGSSQAVASLPNGPTVQAKTTPSEVYDANGSPRPLGTEIASGGEGTVYEVGGTRGSVLVKVFKDDRKAQDKKAKIEQQVRVGGFGKDSRFAWPKVPVYNRSRQFIGYAMNRVQGISFGALTSLPRFRRDLPHWGNTQVLDAALNVVEGIRGLHAEGIHVGDFNPENFFVDKATSQVFFIDCDNYALTIAGRRFPCLAVKPEYLAPECIGRPLSSLSLESELFSLAVFLYAIVTHGSHPYNHVGGGSPIDNLKKGKTPVDSRSKATFPKGPWQQMWQGLPTDLQALFQRAFITGHGDPSARPVVDQWLAALRKCRKSCTTQLQANTSKKRNNTKRSTAAAKNSPARRKASIKSP